MNKFNKFVIMALTVLTVLAGTMVVSACGESAPDYTTYTYDDYAAMTDADWDAKTISYQFEVDTSVRKSINLLNLYSDGTALMYQVGLYITEGLDDSHWVDEDSHIAWDFYGLWEEKEDKLNIHLVGELVADKTVTVSLEDDWMKVDGAMTKHCFQVTAEKNTYGEFTLSSGCGLNSYFANNNGTYFPEPFTRECVATAGSSIVYSKLSDFIEKYANGEFELY